MDPVTPRDGTTIAHQKHDEGPALMLVHGTLRSRMSAVRTARSAQSSRGRELARRSTATSCRSTSSLASFAGGWSAEQDQPAAKPDEDEIKQADGHG